VSNLKFKKLIKKKESDLRHKNQKEELCEELLGKKYKNRAKVTEGPHIVCTQWIWHIDWTARKPVN
jgi:hypothetical protein